MIAILNQLPISAYSGLLKFNMKVFVNVARLENKPVVYSRHEVGAFMYFGHISSLSHMSDGPMAFREDCLQMKISSDHMWQHAILTCVCKLLE